MIKKIIFKFPLIIMLFSVIFVLQGCLVLTKQPEQPVEKPLTTFLRGTVYLEQQHYKIRFCGSSSIAVLKDPQQHLTRYFNTQSGQLPSLYFEISASAANSIDWELDEVHFSGQNPAQCGTRLRGVTYALMSVDGQLQGQIVDNRVSLNKQDLYTQLVFAAKREKETWRGDLQFPQGRRFKMLIEKQPGECRDSNGQWYSQSATVKLNAETYQVCLRKGDPAKQFASGNYSNALANASAFIVLDLQQDNKARLILDYRNGHPLVINQGDWKMLSDHVLELRLVESAAGGEQSVMLFEVFNNNELRLKGFSELLGSSGLKLLPIE